MLRFLIFLIILAGCSFFLVEVDAIEIELLKEEERIMQSMGWLDPGKIPYQEQIQIMIGHSAHKNKISVGMMSKDQSDIKFPDDIEFFATNPKVISFIITNQFGCAPNKISQSCIIVDIEREGLGNSIEEIKKNTREVTDWMVTDGMTLFSPTFDSVMMKSKTNFDGEKVLVSRAIYTINKQSSNTMFNALSPVFISSDIRNSGGFYEYAEKLSENNFSTFSVSLIPMDDGVLRTVQLSLDCSDKLPELIRCPPNVTEQIAKGEISPLDFIQTENINRSSIFEKEFVPLNSIIQVYVFSDEDLQVKSVNNNIIEKLQNIGDIQDDGWFFSLKSKQIIDARYLFGAKSSVSKDDLIFTIGPNTGDIIQVKNDGGCLIATAAFGSEMAPQVQFLREIRDNTVLQTESGSAFMTGFNQFYYSFSPAVADYERENQAFKETVKITLTPLLTSLTLLQYADIDSESEMLGYGIGVILLNIGMYFVAPAVLIMKIKKLV